MKNSTSANSRYIIMVMKICCDRPSASWPLVGCQIAIAMNQKCAISHGLVCQRSGKMTLWNCDRDCYQATHHFSFSPTSMRQAKHCTLWRCPALLWSKSYMHGHVERSLTAVTVCRPWPFELIRRVNGTAQSLIHWSWHSLKLTADLFSEWSPVVPE